MGPGNRRPSGVNATMEEPLYAFEVAIHRRAHRPESPGGSPLVDAWGTWPTLDVPVDRLAEPMATGFDVAFGRLAALERMFVEADGSFVWVSPGVVWSWQVDGNALERDGRLLLVELRGSCPASAFDPLLACFGWPEEPVMMQLLRPAVFLDETTFRDHASRRGAAGDAAGLRPG